MLDTLAIEIANHATRIIELTGIAIITIGGFATLALFIYRLVSGFDRNEAVQKLRSSLGRAILLGLEFLVAADISTRSPSNRHWKALPSWRESF